MTLLTTVFLCHLFINWKTYLVVTRKPELCWSYPYAQQVHVSLPYDTEKRFDDDRLSAICGYSMRRCPTIGEN